MVFIYSCPRCGKVLGADAEVIAPVCPGCQTRFDPEILRKTRSRDRWMQILMLTGCCGVGGLAVVTIAASNLAPDSPRMGTFVLLGFVAGIVGGFFALKRYDAWKNGPL